MITTYNDNNDNNNQESQRHSLTLLSLYTFIARLIILSEVMPHIITATAFELDWGFGQA